MSETAIETIISPEVALHLNSVHFPVLCVTWFGRPTIDSVRRYGAWLHRMATRAEEQGTQIVLLGDVTALDGRPGPEVRKAMGETIIGLAEQHPHGLLGGTTIVGDPLMRAALIIVVALSRRKLVLKPVKTFEQALARTHELLDAAGIERPPGLDAATYQQPERPH